MNDVSLATEILTGTLPQGYELTADDIGRILSHSDGFSVVQAGDVGKRIWRRPYGLVMESPRQRDERIASKRA